MKKNNKGISLVSLVVIIISMIILLSVVVTVGYDYIQESNRAKTEAVVKFISDAALQLQNDKQIEVTMYYIGHPFKTDNLDKIKGLPEDFTIESHDIWYLVDAISAEQLGVLDSEKYIEKDLKNPSAEMVKTVLVDYVTGEAYLIEIDRNFLAGIIKDSICSGASGGTHLYSVQTCTKGSFCLKCGAPNVGHESALGHDFAEPTCTAAATCNRCKEIDSSRPATGHEFESDGRGGEKWTTDAIKHWKQCIKCNLKKETDDHEKGYVRISIDASNYDSKYHKEVCAVCGWESVQMEHKIKYEVINDNTHRRFCELCEYSVEHTDSGWIIEDERYHWRECEETCPVSGEGNIDCIDGNKLFYDVHADKNDDGVCDTCLKSMDKNPPNSFTAEGSFARLNEATTSSLKVVAYTEDDKGIKGYKFAIDEDGDGIINWEEIPLIEVEENAIGIKTFINLQANTIYDIYVVALDFGNNQTAQYKIPDTKTLKVPKVQVIGLPSGYVANEFTIGLKLETELPNLTIEYSTDGGYTWTEGTTLTIDKENISLSVRAKDDRTPEPNRGDAVVTTIANYDKTAPTVIVETIPGDEAGALQTSHKAVVKIEDDKAMIAPGTVIRYAWSQNDTTPPTAYTEIKTTNTITQKSTSVEITTPANLTGSYYLWIDKGVEDALGNKTAKSVCSSFAFNIDDEEAALSNIKIYNPTPEVENQSGFVKTNGTIAVTFTANKALATAPTINVGGLNVTNITSDDKINWSATIVAATSMPEGELALKISGIKSLAGKESTKQYTNADLTGSSLIYDRTLPELEYIKK